MCILMNVISVNVQAAESGKASIQSWDLVDSGKHLDWGGTSKYIKEFKSAVKKWNNYKSGVIRKDTIKTKQDVKIVDTKGRAEKRFWLKHQRPDVLYIFIHLKWIV